MRKLQLFCLHVVVIMLLGWINLPGYAQLVNVQQYQRTIRLACVGNSITYGAGIEFRDSLSYPAQLGRLLGTGWDVRNFGVSGRTLLSKGDRPYIREKAYNDAMEFQPDVVLIKLGTNDTKPQNWQYKDEFVNDYRALVASFRELPSKPLVVLIQPVPAFPDRWGIRDSLITADIIPMVGQLATELRLPVIDLHKPFENKAELFPDKIHPNAEGAGLMAELIYKALVQGE